MKKSNVVMTLAVTVIVGLVMFGQTAQTPFTIPTYVTNHINSMLTPYDVTICDSVRLYKNTNDAPVTVEELKAGDQVVALVDIPYNKMTNEPPTTNRTSNVVGYMFMNVPGTNTSPNMK